jgi:hypothetical protein
VNTRKELREIEIAGVVLVEEKYDNFNLISTHIGIPQKDIDKVFHKWTDQKEVHAGNKIEHKLMVARS